MIRLLMSKQPVRLRSSKLGCCTDAPIGAPARTLFYARAIRGAGHLPNRELVVEYAVYEQVHMLKALNVSILYWRDK